MFFFSFNNKILKIPEETKNYFIDLFNNVHLSHVVGIAICIITPDRKIDWLLGVPADGVTFVRHADLNEGSFSSEVIECDRSVDSCGGQKMDVTRVEFDLQNCITSPLELVEWLGPVVVPDLDYGT